MKFAPIMAAIGTAALLSVTGMSAASATTHEAAPMAKTYNATPRVVQGEIADFSKVPFAAQQNINGSFNCSASIISATWVILAKHCVENQSASSMSFRLGSANLNQGTVIGVKRTVSWSQGDVALAELKTAYNGTYASLGKATPAKGAAGDIYGWGRTAEGAPASPKLKTARVEILGTDTNGWPGPAIVQKGVNGQAYKGDSGGPLIVNGKVVGVCSGPTSADQLAKPDGVVEYASVPASASWITQTSGVAVN